MVTLIWYDMKNDKMVIDPYLDWMFLNLAIPKSFRKTWEKLAIIGEL